MFFEPVKAATVLRAEPGDQLWVHECRTIAVVVVIGNFAKRNYLPSPYANCDTRVLGQLAVALADITREAVLAALAEHDELGQDQFLDKYGFDRARLYVLVHDGKPYDSKAIVGAAHGYLPGQKPLTAGQFSGGEATVGRLLRRLGFTVQVGDALTPDALVTRLTKLRVYRPRLASSGCSSGGTATAQAGGSARSRTIPAGNAPLCQAKIRPHDAG